MEQNITLIFKGYSGHHWKGIVTLCAADVKLQL